MYKNASLIYEPADYFMGNSANHTPYYVLHTTVGLDLLFHPAATNSIMPMGRAEVIKSFTCYEKV